MAIRDTRLNVDSRPSLSRNDKLELRDFLRQRDIIQNSIRSTEKAIRSLERRMSDRPFRASAEFNREVHRIDHALTTLTTSLRLLGARDPLFHKFDRRVASLRGRTRVILEGEVNRSADRPPRPSAKSTAVEAPGKTVAQPQHGPISPDFYDTPLESK